MKLQYTYRVYGFHLQLEYISGPSADVNLLDIIKPQWELLKGLFAGVVRSYWTTEGVRIVGVSFESRLI